MLNRNTLPPNTFLDASYRIERVVGSGGFGITYEAYDVNLGTLVAIKEYFPHDFGDRDGTMSVRPRSEHSKHLFEWGRTNFLHEARTLAGFDHPSIVRVLRVFEAHSTAYMVMRFERGKSFGTWLKELGRKPTQAELDAITAPLLDALEVLHKSNYLHRDIAPDNIIVRPDGSPVLLDFGSARRVIAEMSRMVTGIVKAGYSPHEQYAADNRLQGPWTDIYAMGATLYRAVTQRQPVESMLRFDTDTMETAVALGGADYRPGFLAAIDSCLKVKPSERPQSIADLRRLLHAPPPAPATPTVVISKPSVLATSVREQISVARSATHTVLHRSRALASNAAETFRFEKLGAWLLGSALMVLLLAGSFAIFQSFSGPAVTTSQSSSMASDSGMTTTALPSGADVIRQRQDDDPARLLAEHEARARLAERTERERIAAEAERKRVALLEDQKRAEAERQRVALLEEQRRQREAADAERKRLADLEEQKRLEAERQKAAQAEELKRQREAEAERKRVADLEAQRRKDEEERRQRALLEEQQRKAQAELERRQQAERDEQRRREEIERKRLADLEEKRLKAEAEARRVEAEQQRLAAVPTSAQLVLYVERIEGVLKKASCFDGLKGDSRDDVQTGVARFSEGLKKHGLQKPALIEVASASTGAIETWLKEAGEVRVNACAAPVARQPQKAPPQQRPVARPSYSAPRGPGTITGIQ